MTPARDGAARPPGPDLGRVLVVIPTYQEAPNLAAIVGRTLRADPGVDILVVDDASPDGTGAIAEDLAAAHPPVHVLHRAAKRGLGAAYLAGFAWALERGYDVLVEMDADGSHRPEELDRLLAALAGADLVIGARWVPGGAVQRWSLARQLLSRGGNSYVRVLLGVPLRDATGGFRAFRASALGALDLAGVASAGYCFQVDLAWRAVRAGLRVVEVPITFVEREQGASKMSRAIVGEALWRVTVWGVQRRLPHHQRRRGPVGTRGRIGSPEPGTALPPAPAAPAAPEGRP
jgi:dolichol-phosphate mannosyltransferase